MDEKQLYAAILGLTDPWKVAKVDLRLDQGEILIFVKMPEKMRWVCPECLQEAPIHDHKERQWRHLDTCQYRTILQARVPRLNCPTHGVKQVKVPWAEPGSRFTALFEALAIDWLKTASIQAVAQQMGLTWDQAAGIMKRGVERGLARREAQPLRHLGVDETSFRKRHRYVTVVNDLERDAVLYVGEGRKQETLDEFWTSLPLERREQVEAVAMDMWEPYIRSTREHLPAAESKIVFDKFHVAQHLGQAVDDVRKAEHRELMAQGEHWLKGTRYDWLRHPDTFTAGAWRAFLKRVRTLNLKTGRAWVLKETAMFIWEAIYPGVAERRFRDWYQWARRSRLEPFKKVALLIKNHWPNILTYFTHRITNAGSETINSKIQRVKAMARGFRNRDRFRMAIYFHCAKLDLYPRPLAESS